MANYIEYKKQRLELKYQIASLENKVVAANILIAIAAIEIGISIYGFFRLHHDSLLIWLAIIALGLGILVLIWRTTFKKKIKNCRSEIHELDVAHTQFKQ